MLTVLVVAVAGLTAYAFSQRQAATTAEGSAIKAEVDAITERNQADSREAAFVADQLRAQDPSAAAQLSVAGYRIAQTPQATASLLDVHRDLVGGADTGFGRTRAVGLAQPGPQAARRGGS